MPDWLAITGFVLATCSVIANDAIQTLGTFLSSQRHRGWVVLWLYLGGLACAVLLWGWFHHEGDPAYGRLAGIDRPTSGSWILCLPPVVLLALTRAGIPVSTTFLILTAFAPGALPAMLLKSVSGYAIAFGSAWLLYGLATQRARHIRAPAPQPGDRPRLWSMLQWVSTGLLWSQWLIQDLANLYVYLPRRLDGPTFAATVAGLLILLALILRSGGGRIQEIVTSKTGTAEVKAATRIDLLYAAVLFGFGAFSHIPMSTTWVFLGLMGGRELALAARPRAATRRMLLADLGRAILGLLISILLAWTIPLLA